MDPQDGGQWVGRTAALTVGLGVVRLDQINQDLPLNYLVHLSPELLTVDALLDSDLLVIHVPQLSAAHEPSLGELS